MTIYCERSKKFEYFERGIEHSIFMRTSWTSLIFEGKKLEELFSEATERAGPVYARSPVRGQHSRVALRHFRCSQHSL